MGKATYISLLRGINVSGQKIIKMEQLRDAFEAMGFDGVRTYVQSGNVIFNAAVKSSAALSGNIQMMIAEEFGFEVPVIVRSAEEIARTANSNPLSKEKGIDITGLYVAFLSEKPETAAMKALERYAVCGERFRHSGREIYLYYPTGAGKTKLTNNAIEKSLSVVATTRNWNTVNKLRELSSE